MSENYKKCSLEEFKKQINDWLEKKYEGAWQEGSRSKDEAEKASPAMKILSSLKHKTNIKTKFDHITFRFLNKVCNPTFVG